MAEPGDPQGSESAQPQAASDDQDHDALVGFVSAASLAGRRREPEATPAAPVAAPLGAGMVCPVTVGSLLERDVSEWCAALQGAAETTGAGANRVGAMIGGRGCVEEIEPNREYRVTVVWQGLTAIGAPPDNVTCGADAFDTADGTGVCVDDACRRYVTTLVRIANL